MANLQPRVKIVFDPEDQRPDFLKSSSAGTATTSEPCPAEVCSDQTECSIQRCTVDEVNATYPYHHSRENLVDTIEFINVVIGKISSTFFHNLKIGTLAFTEVRVKQPISAEVLENVNFLDNLYIQNSPTLESMVWDSTFVNRISDKLQSLHLSKDPPSGYNVKHFENFSRLQLVSLDEGVHRIDFLCHIKNLNTIDFVYGQTKSIDFETIACLRDRITKIGFYYNDLVSLNSDHLINFKSLEELEIYSPYKITIKKNIFDLLDRVKLITNDPRIQINLDKLKDMLSPFSKFDYFGEFDIDFDVDELPERDPKLNKNIISKHKRAKVVKMNVTTVENGVLVACRVTGYPVVTVKISFPNNSTKTIEPIKDLLHREVVFSYTSLNKNKLVGTYKCMASNNQSTSNEVTFQLAKYDTKKNDGGGMVAVAAHHLFGFSFGFIFVAYSSKFLNFLWTW
ncbi:hypothetical protein HELRODRAFT_178233 [Helobdella robusta]|uniref:Ig-like domain-containing protein n=1 Tax=Helobdella robusta TaxID=6412 RepID=T1FCZ1_HELRO|nr:hypothetical protein HELRODRAFT_178233 [Helobdella robusta]ESN97436.1 hypothetical protein HELRODRAFT_178233 [Helobdella robusta]